MKFNKAHVVASTDCRACCQSHHRVPGDEVMTISALDSGRALCPLLSLQVRSFLYGFRLRDREGRARLLGAAALIVLLAAVAVTYLWVLGLAMVTVGAGDAIPALASLVGSLAAVALVFVKAPGTIFGCRDYDFVAALPVSARTVVLARTAPLYGFAVALSVLLSAPLYAAYFTAVPALPTAIVVAVVLSVLAPLAPAAVATLVSLALTSVAVRFRHAGAVQLVLSTLLVAGVAIGSFAFGGAYSGADDAAALAAMGDIAGTVSAVVSSAYPPAAWAGAYVVDGSAVGFVAFCALSIACPALVTVGLAAYYPAANAQVALGSCGRSIRVHAAAPTSPLCALTRKELRRIGSMPSYAVNDCAGLVLMIAMAVAIVVLGVDELLVSGVINGVQFDAHTIEAMRTQIDAALPWVFGFCGAMSLTAGPAVSLESRASWLMLTVPVSAGAILASKLLANVVLGVAVTVASAVVLLVGGTGPLLILQCAVCAMGMLVGFASVALAIDASRPNFVWTSPSEVVKRGLPVMVGSIGGVLASFGFAFLSVMAAATFGSGAAAAVNLVVPAACAFGGLTILRAVARRGIACENESTHTAEGVL